VVLRACANVFGKTSVWFVASQCIPCFTWQIFSKRAHYNGLVHDNICRVHVHL
jgi:hypothetical protein